MSVADSSGHLAWKVLLVVAYLSLNSLLSLTNKWALGMYGFSFPLLLTTSHMAFTFCALLPIMLQDPYRSRHSKTLQDQWKGLATIGFCMAANVSLNNFSLVLITLSLNQVIRSATPVITATLAVFIENKIPTSKEAFGLLTLTIGVMVCVWQGSVTGSFTGLLLCIAGTVCSGVTICTAGKVLTEKVDAMRLAFYTAPVSCAVLFPLALIHEVKPAQQPAGVCVNASWQTDPAEAAEHSLLLQSQKVVVFWKGHRSEVLLILLSSSVVAFLYNMVHFMTIQKTSAVTTTVIGEVKVIGLLILSALVLGEVNAFNLHMTLGVTLAMVGFSMYSHTKLKQQEESASNASPGLLGKLTHSPEEASMILPHQEQQRPVQ